MIFKAAKMNLAALLLCDTIMITTAVIYCLLLGNMFFEAGKTQNKT